MGGIASPMTETGLRVGTRLGPFEVLAPLGKGGMGCVYVANDARLDRRVALKVLAPELGRDPCFVQRFESEARAASALNHPAIVTILDVGETDGIQWIAMELVEGETLRSAMRDGPMEEARVVEIGAGVAEALAAAHAARIVHRDLKPENIMLAAGGRAKILDFGLAKRDPGLSFEESDETDPTRTRMEAMTREGTVIGTAGYMSPEQASGRPVDFRSDQFSLGIILYEMLAGRRAFRRESPAETLAAILRDDPESLALIKRPPSDRFRQVIERCLAKRPEERYASTAELHAELRDLPRGDRPEPTVAVPRPAATTRRAVLVGAGALAAGLGPLAMFSSWFRARREAIGSVAVLPFRNATGDADVDYLSDGLTESLIDQLSRVSTLKVMARATVFRYRDKTDPLEVGRLLKVGAIVIGSVDHRKQSLRIAVELVDVTTGARLWGGEYNRPFSAVIQIQDEITREISDGLRLSLTQGQQDDLLKHGTADPEAYALFLRGRYQIVSDTEEGYLAARRLFQQATLRDPSFTSAILGEADTYGLMAVGGYVRPTEAWSRSAVAARRALKIDPALPGARASLAARAFFEDRDWSRAESEFRNALGLEAVVGDWCRVYALLLWVVGRPEEAYQVIQRALATDPANNALLIASADYQMYAHQLDRARSIYEAAIDLDPQDLRARFGLAQALSDAGDFGEAAATLRRAYQLSGSTDLAEVLANVTSRRAYEQVQQRAAEAQLKDIVELSKTRYVSPYDVARLQAFMGRRESAIEQLKAAVEDNSPGLVFLKVDRDWQRMRDDPRFVALVEKLGLP